jgi:hypothetical protein
MQFRQPQLEALQCNWHGGSWFYSNLGLPARLIVEAAYGLINIPVITPNQRKKAQEDLTTAMSIFARRVGCDKSQAVHALLSGSIESLHRAIERNGNASSEQELRDAWEAAFRDINIG